MSRIITADWMREQLNSVRIATRTGQRILSEEEREAIIGKLLPAIHGGPP